MARTFLVGRSTLFWLALFFTNTAVGGQILWLDASDSSTIQDSFGVNPGGASFVATDVTTWTDKSGQGNHAMLQGGSPTWMATARNGLDLLEFEQADSLSYPAVSSTTTGANPGITGFIVVKSTGVAKGNAEEFDCWIGNSSDGSQFITDRGDFNGISFGIGDEGRAHAPGGASVNDFHLITVRYDFVRGMVEALFIGDPSSYDDCHPPGNTPCIAEGKTVVFDQISRYHGGNIAGLDGEGQLAEIRFYDESLDSAVEANIGAELGQKWAITTSYGPVTLPKIHNWSGDRSGDWNVSSNWDSRPIPDGNDQTAIFGAGIITSGQTVFTNTAVTVNQVHFHNALSYAIGGLGSVNLTATTATTPVPPVIEVQSGNHQFQAIVNLLDSTTANIADGSSIEFNNRLLLNGHTLTKMGEGELIISNTLNTGGGTLNVTAGTLSGGGQISGNLVVNGAVVSPGTGMSTASVVPEPATGLLLGIGLLLSAVCRIRKQRSCSY